MVLLYINICLLQISKKSVKKYSVVVELYYIHHMQVRVPRARKKIIIMIYWYYQLFLWKQRNRGRTSFQCVSSTRIPIFCVMFSRILFLFNIFWHYTLLLKIAQVLFLRYGSQYLTKQRKQDWKCEPQKFASLPLDRKCSYGPLRRMEE